MRVLKKQEEQEQRRLCLQIQNSLDHNNNNKRVVGFSFPKKDKIYSGRKMEKFSLEGDGNEMVNLRDF